MAVGNSNFWPQKSGTESLKVWYFLAMEPPLVQLNSSSAWSNDSCNCNTKTDAMVQSPPCRKWYVFYVKSMSDIVSSQKPWKNVWAHRVLLHKNWQDTMNHQLPWQLILVVTLCLDIAHYGTDWLFPVLFVASIWIVFLVVCQCLNDLPR